jgi:hypothetical protein
MVTFSEEFPPLYRITQNGWDVDRFLLTNIDKSEWMRIAASVQSALTDEVIDEALQRMPREFFQLRGLEIGTKLKTRPNQLTELAERDYYYYYYYHLSDYVDVHGSNAPDYVVLRGYEGGEVELAVSVLQADRTTGEPYYLRRFKKDETKEVRVYLHGGDNRVETLGKHSGGIKVRVIGGSGHNSVAVLAGPTVTPLAKLAINSSISHIVNSGGKRQASSVHK